MSILIFLRFSLTIAFILPLISQPLRLGLVVILSTLFICLLAGLFFSSWYAYILFLIYVGGLLVIFIYVATLIPNILFINNGYLTFFFVSQVPLIWGFSSYVSKSLKVVNYNEFISFKISKLYGLELISPSLISVFIGLRIVLLLNLIVVVKICYYYYGRLRVYN